MLVVAAVEAERRHQDTYPTPAQLLERLESRPGSSKIVALASPADTPAPGTIGYYSDGRLHVAVVVVSAAGRRLFIEYEDDVLHTNIAGFLNGGLD